jgi:hypothetical protein
MDFVDRLDARAQGALPLIVGSFSDLAANARDEQWISQSVNGSSNRAISFSTALLLRALHAADFIVTEIESHGSLLEFFAGTSRDILVYECLHFSVFALSDVLLQTVPLEENSGVSHFREAACLTASILGSQHIGDFDSAKHCQDRAQRYLPHLGKLREMTECLIDLLISARGATVIQLSDTPSEHDVGIETEVSLRSTTNAAVDICIGENAEKLIGQYSQPVELPELASAGGQLPQTEAPASAAMSYYCVQSRSQAGPMQTFWVLAKSANDARTLVALNVPSAARARDKKLFDCLVDDTRTPPVGLIYGDNGGSFAISIT